MRYLKQLRIRLLLLKSVKKIYEENDVGRSK
jgi:hypothetical protein